MEVNPYDVQIGGKHYKQFQIQPHEYIVKNGIGWSAGNAIKYLSRYKHKGGSDDVKKAIHYCMMLLKEEYGETYSEHTGNDSGHGVEERSAAATPCRREGDSGHPYNTAINTARYY